MCAHFRILYPVPLEPRLDLLAVVQSAVLTLSSMIGSHRWIARGGGSDLWYVGTTVGLPEKNLSQKIWAFPSGSLVAELLASRSRGKMAVHWPVTCCFSWAAR